MAKIDLIMTMDEFRDYQHNASDDILRRSVYRFGTWRDTPGGDYMIIWRICRSSHEAHRLIVERQRYMGRKRYDWKPALTTFPPQSDIIPCQHTKSIMVGVGKNGIIRECKVCEYRWVWEVEGRRP